MNSQPTIYTIRVQGLLDPHWADCFNGLSITFEDGDPPVTRLAGPVRDQSVLRGMVNKLWDLNLTLLSITCEEDHDH